MPVRQGKGGFEAFGGFCLKKPQWVILREKANFECFGIDKIT